MGHLMDKSLTIRGGRTLCNAELTEEICALVRKGIFPGVAASACGVAARTWRSWVQKARDGEQPYLDAVDAVEQAKSQALVHFVPQLLAAAEKSPEKAWMAIARWAEAFDAGNWERKQTVRMEGEVHHTSAPIRIELIERNREALPAPEVIDGHMVELPDRVSVTDNDR